MATAETQSLGAAGEAHPPSCPPAPLSPLSAMFSPISLLEQEVGALHLLSPVPKSILTRSQRHAKEFQDTDASVAGALAEITRFSSCFILLFSKHTHSLVS